MRRTPAEVWASLPQPFRTADAVDTGLAGTTVTAAADRRDLVTVAPGVYAEPRTWARMDRAARHAGTARAACRATEETTASHWSGAVLLGSPVPRGLPPEAALTSLGTHSTHQRPDWRIVHHGLIEPHDVIEHDGTPVTAWARTVLDCARSLHPADGVAIADHALRTGRVSASRLALMRARQRRWPGVVRADAVLSLADGRRENWLESASAWVVESWGWPRPLSQVWLHRPDGSLIGRVDQLFPELGVVGEPDGLEKYAMGAGPREEDVRRRVTAALKAEREREREIEGSGLAVARWGYHDLRGGGRAVDRELRRAVARARPERVALRWRLSPGDALRPWSDLLPPDSDHTRLEG